MSQNQEDRIQEDCPCAGASSTGTTLSLIDVLTSSFDVESVTEDAAIGEKGGKTTRGQNEEKCPTDPLPLHGNLTGAVVNVSGDLVVDPKSCSVKISWKVGAGGAAVFPPGTNFGITVPVAAGFTMNGHCVKHKDRKLCKWSFTRTSP